MTIELRPYQKHDCAQLLAGMARGESIVRQLPTGGGKGVEIAHIIAETVPHGWTWNVVTHRKEIRRQISKHLTELKIPHGQIAPGTELTSHPVHVTSIDTIASRIGSMEGWLRSTRAMPDECHHSVAPEWDQVLRMAPLRCGFTATPGRLDGTGLGDTGLYGRLVQGPSIRALTEMGFLAPARVYAPPSSADWSQASGRSADFVLRQISKMVNTPEFTNMALLWYAHHCPGQPCVVFCTTREHAEDVATAFRRAGWRAASVDGTMRGKDRDEDEYDIVDRTLQGLGTGDVQIVTSCELIGEGTDIPSVAAVIDLRPTESTPLWLQHIGRCLRLHWDKTWATVLDLVGNSARHGYYAAERMWSLMGGLQGTDLVLNKSWRCRSCHEVHEVIEGEAQICGCGARGKFINVSVDAQAPIAGIPAFQLIDMPFMEAQDLMRTRSQLVQFGKLKGLKSPVRYATDLLERRAKQVAAQ